MRTHRSPLLPGRFSLLRRGRLPHSFPHPRHIFIRIHKAFIQIHKLLALMPGPPKLIIQTLGGRSNQLSGKAEGKLIRTANLQRNSCERERFRSCFFFFRSRMTGSGISFGTRLCSFFNRKNARGSSYGNFGQSIPIFSKEASWRESSGGNFLPLLGAQNRTIRRSLFGKATAKDPVDLCCGQENNSFVPIWFCR